MVQSVRFTTNTTAWVVLATDGTGYASLSALSAAGKTALPGRVQTQPADIIVHCENGSGSPGGALYVAFDKGAAFAALGSDELRDQEAIPLASGLSLSKDVLRPDSHFALYNIWVRKTTGTDEAVINLFW